MSQLPALLVERNLIQKQPAAGTPKMSSDETSTETFVHPFLDPLIMPFAYYRTAKPKPKDNRYADLVRKVTGGIEAIVSFLYLFTLGTGIFPVKKVTWMFLVLTPTIIPVISHTLVAIYFTLRLAAIVIPTLCFGYLIAPEVPCNLIFPEVCKALGCFVTLSLALYTLDYCIRGPKPWWWLIVDENGRLLDGPPKDWAPREGTTQPIVGV